MFELWHKIEERGSVANPMRHEALSHLEWAEVAERYPELVPDGYRGVDVYSDEQLVSTYLFVRVGNACKFKVQTPGGDFGIRLWLRLA